MNEQVLSFLPMILVLGVFYFLIMRPQQKKFKAHQQMLTELKKGDKVVTGSGMVGKITKVSDRFFTVEIAPNVNVEFERQAITARLDATGAAVEDKKD
ncbi:MULTISPECIES: preprotein translocase subunit YajC [Vitreoscilla]|uniref:Sec translocon accessory complex subunit YajC n=1 Tax=Vitreoscilla stercoraria TaxID=61 RepID=A0ABY4EA23_VITST|nr:MULTISPECIES: preprotein translocase subunit YajC [Vitreoscilla]AUZ04503.1 subunit YajC of preprotein translocase [Vitreoscilla sp. C1]UOO91785.1 preprotein translocase subunit YajC [Vitreoscilla stercoraria]